jgi:hypothetical protein
VCGHCGSRLKTHTTSNAAKTKYFYYVCPKRTSNRDNGTCPNTKHYRAEALELLVRDILLDALQEETWADFVDKTYSRRMEDLRKMHRFDPSKTRERLLKRIDSLETKMTRLVDLFTDDDISKETYQEKKSFIQEQISGGRDELSKIDDLDTEMDRLEDLRAALLSVENPFSGHYVFVGDVDPNVVVDHGLSYGSKETAARRRLNFYRQAALRVKVGQETEISLDIGGTSVRKSARASDNTRSPTGTP